MTTRHSDTYLTVRCRKCINKCNPQIELVRVLDSQLRIIWTCGSYGVAPDDAVIGKSGIEMTHPDDQEVPLEAMRYISQSKPFRGVSRDVLEEDRWWLITILPAHGIGGQAGAILRARSVCRNFFLLSKSQRKILSLMSRGMSIRQIAADLRASPNTIRTHVERAMEKIGLLDSAELHRWSYAHTTILDEWRGKKVIW